MRDRRGLGLTTLSMGLLVVMMDATILNVALPEIAADVQPSSVQLLWIVDVYSLVVGGLLVTSSAIGSRIGRRRVLLAGYVCFGAGSLLVLIAQDAAALIAVRALLGVGGAMIMPGTLAMVRTLFADPRERSTALGVWAAVAGVGVAVGPVVGGALLEAFSWHSAFLVNVPVMVIAFAATATFLPESRSSEPSTIDTTGVVLSIAGAIALLYAIKHLGQDGVTTESAASFIVGVLALGGFTRHCLRSDAPMLDVRLLKDRRVLAGVLTALVLMLALGGVLLVGAQWLQLVNGLTPLESGLTLLPLGLTSLISSLVLPGLAERFGARTCIVGALVVGAVGLFVPIAAPGPVTIAWLATAYAILGLGSGSLATASSEIMSGTPESKAGSAAAIDETGYEVGSALGVAVLGTLGLAVYRHGLPVGADAAARESVAGAMDQGGALATTAASAFTDGMAWASATGGLFLLLAAAAVGHLLRDRAAHPVAAPVS